MPEYNGMKCRKAGRSGLWLSEVGLGLWKWGDPSYDGARVGDHDGFEILDRALELGAFHWDTACSYNRGAGNSERLLGRYFASRGVSVREKVVLATKVKNPVREEHSTTMDATPNQSGASRVYIRNGVENCLRRLQTDYIDLLYIHAPTLDADGNFVTPLEETWGAMDDLISQGKVCYIAVSNHTTEQIAAVQKVLSEFGKDLSRAVVAVQNRYSLLERDRVSCADGVSDTQFLNACPELGVGVVPFFPLASGALTGRYRKGQIDGVEGRIAADKTVDTFLSDQNMDAVEALIPLAEAKGVSLAQFAIAWLLAKEQVSSVIAGVTRMEQLEDNVKAPAIQFSEDELKQVDAALATSR